MQFNVSVLAQLSRVRLEPNLIDFFSYKSITPLLFSRTSRVRSFSSPLLAGSRARSGRRTRKRWCLWSDEWSRDRVHCLMMRHRYCCTRGERGGRETWGEVVNIWLLDVRRIRLSDWLEFVMTSREWETRMCKVGKRRISCGKLCHYFIVNRTIYGNRIRLKNRGM